MKWGLQYINPKMIDLLNDLFQWLLENVYFLNNLKKLRLIVSTIYQWIKLE
jgi:hypothetical protein